ncbi:hypothetical protein [Kibdelosporangium aridum]|uniref:hypothetical protein n=1 Tax=Kibdelosporangium aridum TaxID=2030 RepID=UPI000525C012
MSLHAKEASTHNTDMDNEPDRSLSSRDTSSTPSLAILCDTVLAGLGGLYVTTQSVIITAIAAGAVTLLALCVAVTRR